MIAEGKNKATCQQVRGLAFNAVSKTVKIQQLEYPILSNINGVVYSSQMMALVGLSGCGKTTLLHVLSGGVPRNEFKGNILLDGHTLTKADKRDISLVRQDDVFFSHLTVREHLAFTALLRFQNLSDIDSQSKLETRITSERVRATVESLVNLLSLEKCAHTQIRFISGGEKKRCSIASELLTRPTLLLLDEAASGLDSAAATFLVGILRLLARGHGWQEGQSSDRAEEFLDLASVNDSDDDCHDQEDAVDIAAAPSYAALAPPAIANCSAHVPSVPGCTTETLTPTGTPMAIIMSIHQPSPSLLNTFDKVMILSEGFVVYYGSPFDIDAYARDMESKCLAACDRLTEAWHHSFLMHRNKQCPRSVSSLDFLIERLSSKCPWVVASIDTRGGGYASHDEGREDLRYEDLSYETAVVFLQWPRCALVQLYDKSTALFEYDEYCACAQSSGEKNEEGAAVDARPWLSTGPREEAVAPDEEGESVRLPYWTQFCVLLNRSLILTSRSSWATSSSLIETIVIALIGGLCWWNTRLTEDSVVDITGFLSFSTTFWFFSSLYVGLLEFFPERPVLEKERGSGSYRLSSYFLSKFVANIPLRVALPVLYISIAYPMAFHGDELLSDSKGIPFFSVLGIIVLVSQCGESIGMVIGTLTIKMEVAMATATSVSLAMLIFGGFYKQNMSSYVKWLSSLSPLKYSYDASVQVTIGSEKDINCNEGEFIPACFAEEAVSSGYVLDWLNVKSMSNSPGMNVLYLAVMAVGFRILAYFCLRFIRHRPARGYN